MNQLLNLKKQKISSEGFTLLEIALAMAILSIVAIYTLDMYQSVSARKKLMDNRGKTEKITTAFKAYFSGHEGLPPAGTTFTDSIPISDLGLNQSYRFDSYGRPYLYFSSGTAAGFQVDGKSAAGVIISLGDNQLQEYNVTGTNFTTAGDDTLFPIEVNAEAVTIALAELETLGKRVEAYNREFAGIQENPGTSYYGDETSGAPPIIDPDDYDAQYPTWPQLYPYNSTSYTTFPDAGPPPADEDLVYDQPDYNWPDALIYNNWPNRPPDPPTGPDLPPGFAGWSAPGFAAWPFDSDVFGEYNPVPFEQVPPPGTNPYNSYELIDEGGCFPSADPNCSFVDLDSSGNPVNFIAHRYGLGSTLETDPWGSPYQWGNGLPNTDPRYHLFFSAGPDNTSGTPDDIILF